ncbi:hypothetical protein CGMCC3_g17431 [Colletotrichum fructicola]|nr:uncharacterized protein CGMCC3_g17431 [Colletotrichum fructicola]KAE9566416.1 hypothetical protein CGMCC3_g17431 [Colletotrichum fructicola]
MPASSIRMLSMSDLRGSQWVAADIVTRPMQSKSDIEASTNFSKVSPLPISGAGSGEDCLVFTLRTGVECQITGGYYVTYVEYRGAKNNTIHDVIHSLRRLGAPIYDFDPETYHATKKSQEGSIDRSWPTAFFSTPK